MDVRGSTTVEAVRGGSSRAVVGVRESDSVWQGIMRALDAVREFVKQEPTQGVNHTSTSNDFVESPNLERTATARLNNFANWCFNTPDGGVYGELTPRSIQSLSGLFKRAMQQGKMPQTGFTMVDLGSGSFRALTRFARELRRAGCPLLACHGVEEDAARNMVAECLLQHKKALVRTGLARDKFVIHAQSIESLKIVPGGTGQKLVYMFDEGFGSAMHESISKLLTNDSSVFAIATCWGGFFSSSGWHFVGATKCPFYGGEGSRSFSVFRRKTYPDKSLPARGRPVTNFDQRSTRRREFEAEKKLVEHAVQTIASRGLSDKESQRLLAEASRTKTGANRFETLLAGTSVVTNLTGAFQGPLAYGSVSKQVAAAAGSDLPPRLFSSVFGSQKHHAMATMAATTEKPSEWGRPDLEGAVSYHTNERFATRQAKSSKHSRLDKRLQDGLVGFWETQSSHVSGDRNENSRRLHITYGVLEANLCGRFPAIMRAINRKHPEVLEGASKKFAIGGTLSLFEANMWASVACCEQDGFCEREEYHQRKAESLQKQAEKNAAIAYKRLYKQKKPKPPEAGVKDNKGASLRSRAGGFDPLKWPLVVTTLDAFWQVLRDRNMRHTQYVNDTHCPFCSHGPTKLAALKQAKKELAKLDEKRASEGQDSRFAQSYTDLLQDISELEKFAKEFELHKKQLEELRQRVAEFEATMVPGQLSCRRDFVNCYINAGDAESADNDGQLKNLVLVLKFRKVVGGPIERIVLHNMCSTPTIVRAIVCSRRLCRTGTCGQRIQPTLGSSKPSATNLF